MVCFNGGSGLTDGSTGEGGVGYPDVAGSRMDFFFKFGHEALRKREVLPQM